MIEAGQLSMNHTPESPRKAVAAIERLLNMLGIAQEQQVHSLVNLSRALQHGGDFSRALGVLKRIEIPQQFENRKWVEAHIRLDKASCLSALGQHSTAANEAADLINSLSALPKSEHSGFLLQCGKIFHLAGDTSRAEELPG